MRVKVSHSIELADVPMKIKDMLKEVEADLHKQLEKVKAASGLCDDVSYMPSVVAVLDGFRKGLTDVDQLSAEAHAIASGLVDYYSPKEPEVGEGIDDMQEVLEKMGEQINAAQQELNVHEG